MRLVKCFSLILALLTTLGGLAACSKFKYDNSTVMAKVESIDGQKVVLIVGEMDIGEGMQPGALGSIPDLGGTVMPDMEDLPEGFDSSQIPSGQMPEGFDGTQMPNGQMPEGFDGMQIPNGQFPSGLGDMQMPFNETGDKITLTLNEQIVKTLSVGSIVQITFGDNGSVEALTSLDDVMSGLEGEGLESFTSSTQKSAPNDSDS